MEDTIGTNSILSAAVLKKIKNSSVNLIVATIPLYLMGWFYYGFSSIILGMVAAVTGSIFEIVISKMRRRTPDYKDFSSPAIAMMLTVMLPATSPVWLVVLGCFIALAVAKYPFGGTGSYIFHPVAVAYSFLAISYPDRIFKYPVPFQTVGILNNASNSLSYGPESALRLGGVPTSGHLKIFIGNVPGPIGAACVAVILTCFLYLLITKAVDYRIILPFFATVAVMAFIFPRVTTGRFDSVYYELFSGTVIFCGIFLASDYTINPKKYFAKIIYAVTLGITTMLFQYFGAVQHGFCFAILLCNAAVPLFENVAPKSKKDQSWVEVTTK